MPTIPASGIRRVTELAWATPGTIVLSVGEPDHPDLDEIEAAPPRPRVLLLNSPSNPLGTALPADLLENLVDRARRHDL